MVEILYNVTLTVDAKIETEWRNWMLEVHIPDVLKCKGFIKATQYKLELLLPAASDQPQYVNSFLVESRAALEAYLKGPDSARLREDHQKKFGKFTLATRAVWSQVKDFS